MASNLLKTLKKIDDGRLECIRIAKELGHDVSDNASLQDIANCLVEAGYPKYYPSVDIDEVKAGRKKWVRPDYMYDLEPIFNAAESFTGEDGNVYYPLYVVSFRTSYESIQIHKNNLCASGTIAVKTSDGVTYENAQITTTAFTHTWDSTKTDKYYIVVYGTEAYYNKSTAIKVTTALNHYEAMEVYLGAGYYGQWATNSNYTQLVSIVIGENVKVGASTTDFFICNSSYFRHLKILTPEWAYSSNGSGRYAFRYCERLTHIECPEITSFNANSGVMCYGLDSAREGGYCTYCYLPKVTAVKGYSAQKLFGDTSIIDLPELTTISTSSSSTTSWSHNLNSIIVNIPNFSGGTSHSFTLSNVVIFNYKDGLTLGSLIIDNMTQGFKFDKTINISGSLKINCYLYSIDLTKFKMTNVANISAPKVENIKFPAISTSFDLSKFLMLSKNSIVEFLDNLPITENSYTITLSTGQKNKLSESELRIATDKGWVIETV